MLKQFNINGLYFDEPYITQDDKGNQIKSTSGVDWYPVETQQDIDAIWTTVTGGGAVWVEDGKLQWSGAAPTEAHEWQNGKWIINTEKQTEIKSRQQAQVKQRINDLRDAKNNGGVYFEALKHWFDSDEKAEMSVFNALNAMQLTKAKSREWTTLDNQQITLSAEQFRQLYILMVTHKDHNHTIAQKHKTALIQAENPLEYDYSDGWTADYEQHH